MERRRSRASIDELTLVKAAAWAWYEHGSRSEAKLKGEYHVTRTSHAPKPSRYKIEAMKAIVEKEEKQQQGGSHASISSSPISPTSPMSPGSTNYIEGETNSLLDAYEVERISRHLDDLIVTRKFHHGFATGSGDRDRRKVAAWQENDDNKIRRMRVKKKEKKLGGMWSIHGMLCGSMEDVVMEGRVFRDPRRRFEKLVPHVKQVHCRPRASHA